MSSLMAPRGNPIRVMQRIACTRRAHGRTPAPPVRRGLDSGFAWVLLSAAMVILTGCAGYRIEPEGTRAGYDIYAPRPFLLVTKGKNSAEARIVYLPDYAKRYRISTWNFLAKSDITFKFEDGWRLSSIADKTDNRAALEAVAGLLREALKAQTIALSDRPYVLFAFVFDEHTGRLRGLAPVRDDLVWDSATGSFVAP